MWIYLLSPTSLIVCGLRQLPYSDLLAQLTENGIRDDKKCRKTAVTNILRTKKLSEMQSGPSRPLYILPYTVIHYARLTTAKFVQIYLSILGKCITYVTQVSQKKKTQILLLCLQTV